MRPYAMRPQGRNRTWTRSRTMRASRRTVRPHAETPPPVYGVRRWAISWATWITSGGVWRWSVKLVSQGPDRLVPHFDRAPVRKTPSARDRGSAHSRSTTRRTGNTIFGFLWPRPRSPIVLGWLLSATSALPEYIASPVPRPVRVRARCVTGRQRDARKHIEVVAQRCAVHGTTLG